MIGTQGHNIGIYLQGGRENTFYHNNIKETIDIVQDRLAFDGSGNINYWYIDNEIGGNHWSTHIVDYDDDGFADSPYAIAGVYDAYPWAKENGWSI